MEKTKPWEMKWNFHSRLFQKSKDVDVIKGNRAGKIHVYMFVCVPSRKDRPRWYEVQYDSVLLDSPVLRRFVTRGNAEKYYRSL